MATYETQPTALPTNKATVAATVAGVAATYAGPVVMEVWPQIAPAIVAGPNVTSMIAALASALIGLGAAWFVRDRLGEPAP